MIVLGIETSCDETAVGIVEHHNRNNNNNTNNVKEDEGENKASGVILANIIGSQISLHAPYGGVVPEIAARAHIQKLDLYIQQALTESQLNFKDLNAVAVTSGPGLIGGLMVGLVTAKAIAFAHQLPFLAINHLEAHALTARLSHSLDYPYLLLLISGGHTALISVRGLGDYHCWGSTRDDAIGEAFDKTARLLRLGWPGGKLLEQTARKGNPNAFPLPRPFFGEHHSNFSFAGLKTAIRRITESDNFQMTPNNIANMAASFQQAASDCLRDRTKTTIAKHQSFTHQKTFSLVAAGGVAANQVIRAQLQSLCTEMGGQFIAPPPILCTDNGAMIAWAGAEHLAAGRTDPLTAPPQMRWPLGLTKN